jgi:threonine dehydrogenase-like Zn-dependent dehydrogenase
MQPNNFMLLVKNITLPFAIESAMAPTNGASNTYEITKKSFNKGRIHSGAVISMRTAIAAINKALSANDEKNCAAIIV